MSGLSVQANHYSFNVMGAGDDWNTLIVGGQERSLKTERDVALLMEELAGGRVNGASVGDYVLDGHTVTVGKRTYDLEKSGDAARFAADLRDGTLDGRSRSTDVILENGAAIRVDGQRYGVGSANDVRALVNAFGGADARWVGDKKIQVGDETYDLKNKQGMEALAGDLADGVIDGATAVDPALPTATATAATAAAVDANGYPTLKPDDEGYEDAWIAWMKDHSYEDFQRARERGAIPDAKKLFKNEEFGFEVRNKGEESARFWEMLSFMQRNKQQIFEHLSRGWA